ncbi:L-serine ammonia-lyase, iron-sulfur-dependent, subunit alpha [Desulfofalx alkaliphila]|uniref:L-serine ammonia-lyase, iron-sulfur-dependent, subunit alpha n=1 Tax=Desulfofalx alkaliphila TaxID=105483 RepID=UPI0004E184B4|nr:L-serine ammonia-lyase, iron-sulfur-dependent, subunit alpha [Desulfofalx alkaliphila]
MYFKTMEQLVNICQSEKMRISEVMIKQESETTGISEEEIFSNMSDHLAIMEKAIARGINEDLKSRSGLAGGDAKLLASYNKNSTALSGKLMMEVLTSALATSEVNACMGAVVATPTAGSCGIVPGCILTVGSYLNASRDEMIHSLFTAGAVGLVIANKAGISGAAGGCQAEIGSASGMAAAAVVQLSGGTARQCSHAVAIALKSMLGLVCDPVAGLVEVPCIKRNATGAALAIVASDLALAGIESAIPCDEVIDAMYRVGRSLPETLKETSMGGLATTKTAKAVEKRIFTNP